MNQNSKRASADKFYRQWKHWNPSDFAKYENTDAVYFKRELNESGVSEFLGLSCLELGFGNGQFAAWAKSQGMRYIGTELNDELIELGIKHGFQCIRATTDLDNVLDKNTLDIIVAFDVLEHLNTEELISVLTHISKFLRPGGRVIARVPSGDSPFSRAIQHGDMTHCSTIGSQMIYQLSLQCGLKVLQIRAPQLPIRGVGLRRSIRRASIVLARAIISWLINLIYNDNRAKVISPNLLFVLQRKIEL